jgi:hypothetical protein
MTALPLLDTYTQATVSVSADNYIFVAARKNEISNDNSPYNFITVKRSTNVATGDLSSWETPHVLEIPSGNSGDIGLVSQTSANMLLISGNNSYNISAWKYDGSSWENTGTDYNFFNFLGGYKGLNNNVYALALDTSNNYLYLGGAFTTAYASPSNLTVNYVVRISTISAENSFEALGNATTKGLDGQVNALAIDTSNNYLYLGGAFTTAYASPSNLTVNRIARISTTSATNTFEALGIRYYQGGEW